MRVNKEEIPGVPDMLPPKAKKGLTKSKKRPISEALKDVPTHKPSLSAYKYFKKKISYFNIRKYEC